jgi:hypothetical protein
MGKSCNTHGDKINAYRILVGKTKGKRSFRRLIRRWEHNIKMDLREIVWSDED